jgi:hypothetical protein
MRKVNLVEWTDILFHAERLGFPWNYAHEILRVFQGYDRTMEVDCKYIDEEFEPLTDEYIGNHFKEEFKDDGDLNQMGRDIVYDFMQKHEINEMVVNHS